MQSDRRGSGIFLWLVHSPYACNSWDWFRQKLELHLSLACGVAGTQALEPQLPSQDALAENWEDTAAMTPMSTLIWDMVVTGGSST